MASRNVKVIVYSSYQPKGPVLLTKRSGIFGQVQISPCANLGPLTEFCIVCAAPRSGTTFLSDAVSAAYDTAWPSEIFHNVSKPGPDFRIAEDWDQLGNYFHFRAEALLKRPDLIYPDHTNCRVLFDLYLDHLRELFGKPQLLIDVKYNSWHHFDSFWRFPWDSPYLMHLVRERQIPVVHLVRRNLFSLYCSLRMAEMSTVWHREAGQPENSRMLTVDVKDCHRWMTQMAGTQQLFANWLSGHRVYNLTYENLLENGRFSKEVTDVFARVFGRSPIRELATTYRKVLPPLHGVVQNAPAVLEHFAGTEFDAFVQESLLDGQSTGSGAGVDERGLCGANCDRE